MTGTPFQKIPEAARTTGLSTYFLRHGVRDGSVPHIKSGTVYLVNVPALLRKLDAESTAHEAYGPDGEHLYGYGGDSYDLEAEVRRCAGV